MHASMNRIFHVPIRLIILFALIRERDFSYKDYNYCNAKCFGNKHAACQDGESPKPCLIKCPKNFKHGGYTFPTDEQREKILHIHNSMRNRVAGGLETQYGDLNGKKFSDVQILSWNYESEFIASCNAQTCLLKHDACRTLENKTYCGQNGGERTGATATPSYFEKPYAFDVTVNNWYKEVRNCDGCRYDKYPPKENVPGKDVRHFTQFIWAKTKYIGCAYFCYTDDQKKQKVVLWCNYCPSGNYANQPVMIEGAPGPDCGKDKRYPYLCGVQEPLLATVIFSHKQIYLTFIISILIRFL